MATSAKATPSKTTSAKAPIELQCPQCKKSVVWNDDFPHRPFCSHRCQLIDLGDWAEEKYRVPVSGESDGDEWE